MHWTMGTGAALVAVGIAIGVISGMLGIGGGVLVIPALMFIFGMSHAMAVGTSLGMLLPPIGLAAFLMYYRAGKVDLTASILLAIGFAAGAAVGSLLVTRHIVSPLVLRPMFAFFMIYVARNMLFRSEGRVAVTFYTLLKTAALMIAFGLSFVFLRLVGKRWERSISVVEIYRERLDRPMAPDYEI